VRNVFGGSHTEHQWSCSAYFVRHTTQNKQNQITISTQQKYTLLVVLLKENFYQSFTVDA
jgi:hypothetical protein